MFALSPVGGDTKLVLTHRRLPDRKEQLNVSGGWHTHLAMLEDELAGKPRRPFWSTHAEVVAEYARRFLQEG